MFQSEAPSALSMRVASTHVIGWLAFVFLFVVVVALALGKTDDEPGLIAMIAIFGPAAAIVLLLELHKHVRTGGVDLVIDSRGISQNGWLSTTVIAWPDLTGIECYICGNATVSLTGRTEDGDETMITVAADLHAINADDLMAVVRKHRPDLTVRYTGLFYRPAAERS